VSTWQTDEEGGVALLLSSGMELHAYAAAGSIEWIVLGSDDDPLGIGHEYTLEAAKAAAVARAHAVLREDLGTIAMPVPEDVQTQLAERNARVLELEGMLNTPHIADFLEAVKLEALHQRERWGTEHDAGKAPADWFWLLGYLAGKALASALKGDREKALHHTISSAAVLLNWHAHLSGDDTRMRPGIEPPP
jgi:hypothetical protein